MSEHIRQIHRVVFTGRKQLIAVDEGKFRFCPHAVLILRFLRRIDFHSVLIGYKYGDAIVVPEHIHRFVQRFVAVYRIVRKLYPYGFNI